MYIAALETGVLIRLFSLNCNSKIHIANDLEFPSLNQRSSMERQILEVFNMYWCNV